MQRCQPRLAELALQNRDQPAGQVDIDTLESDRLPNPQSARGEQPDEGFVGVGHERQPELRRVGHEGGDLISRVQVGRRPGRAGAQHASCRDLRLRISGGEVLGEAPDRAQARRPPGRLDVAGKQGPFDGEVERDPLGSGGFKMVDETQEKVAVVGQLVAKRPTCGQVFLGMLAQFAHVALPGQGRATADRVPKSILA